MKPALCPACPPSHCPITPRNKKTEWAFAACAVLLTGLAVAVPMAAHAADDPEAARIYDTALQDWKRGDCPRALPLLRQYQTMARNTLQAHPDFAKTVQSVINGCQAQFAATHHSHTAVAAEALDAAAMDAAAMGDDPARDRPATRNVPTLPPYPPGDDDDGRE
jgi:hypothetical protein